MLNSKWVVLFLALVNCLPVAAQIDSQQLPHDTRIWIKVSNLACLPKDLENCDIASSGLGQWVDHLSRGFFSNLHKADLLEDPQKDWSQWSIADDWPNIFSGDLTFANFEVNGKLEELYHVGIKREHWLWKSLFKHLSSLCEPFERDFLGQIATVYETRDFAVVDFAESITLSSSLSTIDFWLQQPASSRNFSENRKLKTIQAHLAARSPSIEFFVDYGWFVRNWMKGNSSYSKLARESALEEALAFGGAFSLGSRDCQWMLEAFLICGVPRRGVWSAFCFDEMEVKEDYHVPLDTELYLEFRADFAAFEKAVGFLQKGMSEEEQLNVLETVATYAPFFVYPILLKEKMVELFNGRGIYFGRIEPNWLFNSCAIFETCSDKLNEAVEFFRNINGAEYRMESRQSPYGAYFLQAEKSYLATKNRVEELRQLHPDLVGEFEVNRSALAPIENAIMLLAQEQYCVDILRASKQNDLGLLSTDAFRQAVAKLTPLGGNNKPVALLWISGTSIWKLLKYCSVQSGYSSKAQLWEAQLAERQDLSIPDRAIKKTLIENSLGNFETKEHHELQPVCGGLFDEESGLRIILFQPSK